jgi:uncharacterized Fe-S center protein
VTKIKAAITAGIRPVAMLFHEQPSDPWVKYDFLMLEAYQMLQEETCSECGNPIWICRNDAASNVGFKIKTTKCYAKAELEAWQDKRSGKSDTKKRFGEIPYIVPYTYDGEDYPTRISYYKHLAENN